jgi:predicted dehydrogenase
MVGCGELGSRHLQALSALAGVGEIEVVEPRLEALKMGRERVQQVPDRNEAIKYRWLTSLQEASPAGDLCVVATRADVRCRLVREVAEKLSYSKFLIEKFVAQSVIDYEALREFSERSGVCVWVNCKTRAHASHKRVKQHLDPSESLVLTLIGGNHGLANNGIHAADLFVFYDESNRIKGAGGRVDPQLHPSKKREGVFDLSGTLMGQSDKGSQFVLSFTADDEVPAYFSIFSPRYRAIVDDMMRTFYESTRESGWRWTSIPLEENMMVSNMTRRFVADILANNACELPTLEQCYPAHRFILEELQPHFQNLLDTSSDRCPVI